MYGTPETTTGGNALKFYASVRIDIRRVEAIKEGGTVVGNRTRAKIIKNKVAPPFREAVFDIMYGEGISRIGELIDLGVSMDIVRKSGSWFYLGEERIGQGKDSVREYFNEHPEVMESVEAQIREKLYTHKAPAAKTAAQPAAKAVDVSADDFDDDSH